MKEINCLADILAHTPRVRVIKEGDNYGDEFDILCQNYYTKIVTVMTYGEKVFYNYSSVQFLTPVQYEGRYIGLGDKVNDLEVYGYCYADKQWRFCAGGKEYSDCYAGIVDEIESFEPLHQLTPKIELSTEELLEELKRRGVVTSGNIIKS